MLNFSYPLAILVVVNFCHRTPDPVHPPKDPVVTAVSKWASDTSLRAPESVLFDRHTGKLYVSNIGQFNPTAKDGDGFISVLNANGKIENLKWVTGLNDPKGLGLYKGKLYVSDINEVVVIQTANGTIKEKIAIPGALFLNDIAVDPQGKVYVSDMDANKVYQLDKGISEFFSGNEIAVPNGLLVVKDKMVVTVNGTAEVKTINADKSVSLLASGIPDGDGISIDNYGNYFVTNWSGQVFYVKKSGEKQVLLDFLSAGINTADTDFDPETQTLYIPTFFNNRVLAYKIKYN